MREAVTTEKAPKAIGPYSQGIKAGDFVFTAGQAGVDPAIGKLVEGGIAEQTRQVLRNIQSILEAADSSLDRVVKCGVFLQDMADFQAMNAVYAEFFPPDKNPPARTTVQAAKLPLGALVEIDAVALLK
jgi:2-iminobutanoate/2-iminopropanoate deaminase